MKDCQAKQELLIFRKHQRHNRLQKQSAIGWKNNKVKERKHMGRYDDLKLPRASLREPAFRRFEGFIAAATKGSHVIDPLEGKFPCKASSFVVGMREAIRGWRLNKYPTTMWPIDYEMNRIKISEGKDGKVLVENEYEDAQWRKKEEEKEREGRTSVVVDVQGNVLVSYQKEKFLQVFRFGFDELEKMQEALARIQDKAKCIQSPWTHLYLVKTRNEDEVKAIKNIGSEYSELQGEELQHGWWRIIN